MKTLKVIKGKIGRKGRGRKMTIEGAMRQALDAITKDYRSIFKLDIKDGAFDYHIDEAKERELYSSFGKQAIFTDLDGWCSERIVNTTGRINESRHISFCAFSAYCFSGTCCIELVTRD